MANISGKILTKLKEGKGPVTVVSNGTKFSFNSVEEAKKFWTECYYGSEGAEQRRYAEVLMQLQNGNTKITDGTDDRVPSGSKLFNDYNEVRTSGKYYIGKGTDYEEVYNLADKGDSELSTPEGWLRFFHGHDLARNPEAWKDFAKEMNKAGYNKELAALKNRIETGYGVKLEGDGMESSYMSTFINKYKPLYDNKPEMRNNALYISNISLRGSGISKKVEATFTPGCLKVENEEWGFFVYMGDVDFNSMKDMSQYWFYNDYENDESFKAKIDVAAKGLYNDMEKLYNSMKSMNESKEERLKINGKFKDEHPIDDDGFPEKTWFEDTGDGSFTIHLSKEDYEGSQEEAKLYCDCGSDVDPEYVEDYMGVRHGWVCPDCGKFRQIG